MQLCRTTWLTGNDIIMYYPTINVMDVKPKCNTRETENWIILLSSAKWIYSDMHQCACKLLSTFHWACCALVNVEMDLPPSKHCSTNVTGQVWVTWPRLCVSVSWLHSSIILLVPTSLMANFLVAVFSSVPLVGFKPWQWWVRGFEQSQACNWSEVQARTGLLLMLSCSCYCCANAFCSNPLAAVQQPGIAHWKSVPDSQHNILLCLPVRSATVTISIHWDTTAIKMFKFCAMELLQMLLSGGAYLPLQFISLSKFSFVHVECGPCISGLTHDAASMQSCQTSLQLKC